MLRSHLRSVHFGLDHPSIPCTPAAASPTGLEKKIQIVEKMYSEKYILSPVQPPTPASFPEAAAVTIFFFQFRQSKKRPNPQRIFIRFT